MYEEHFKLLVEKPNEALKGILKKHGAQLKKQIERRISDDEDLVKDVISETLLCLYVKREEVAALERPYAWMMTVANNLALSHIRGEHGSSKVSLDNILHPSDSTQADTDVHYKELHKRFIQATEQLTAKEREIVIDAKLHDMENKELGQKYNVSTQRAKNILSSGMKKVRQMLSGK